MKIRVSVVSQSKMHFAQGHRDIRKRSNRQCYEQHQFFPSWKFSYSYLNLAIVRPPASTEIGYSLGQICSCPCLASRNKFHQTTYQDFSRSPYWKGEFKSSEEGKLFSLNNAYQLKWQRTNEWMQVTGSDIHCTFDFDREERHDGISNNVCGWQSRDSEIITLTTTNKTRRGRWIDKIGLALW